MKPFRARMTYSAVAPVSPERWWRHEWDADDAVKAHADVYSVSVEAGRPGEVGCLTRMTGRTPSGEPAELLTEIVEVGPGLRAVSRNHAVGAPDVPTTSEVVVTAHPDGCTVTRVLRVETVPVTWIERAAVRLTMPRHRREYRRTTAREIAESVAYLTSREST